MAFGKTENFKHKQTTNPNPLTLIPLTLTLIRCPFAFLLRILLASVRLSALFLFPAMPMIFPP